MKVEKYGIYAINGQMNVEGWLGNQTEIEDGYLEHASIVTTKKLKENENNITQAITYFSKNKAAQYLQTFNKALENHPNKDDIESVEIKKVFVPLEETEI